MSELICTKCQIKDCECVPYDVECDSCHRAYQQGRADAIDDVMKLFNEMRPYLATSVCEFAYRLEQIKGEVKDE